MQLRQAASPTYHRLYVLLSEQIRDGVYQPSDVLPSENRLAETYGCSRVTVRHALQLLSQEGLVSKRKGSGTVVCIPPSAAEPPRLRGPINDLIARGIHMRAAQLFWGAATTPALAADHRGFISGAECLLVRRVRFYEDEPVSYSSIYVPHHVGELLAPDKIGDRLIIEALDDTPYSPQVTEHTLTATVADGGVSEHLELPAGSPVLRMRGVAFDAAKDAVYFQESYYHSAKFEYAVRLTRGESPHGPTLRPTGR